MGNRKTRVARQSVLRSHQNSSSKTAVARAPSGASGPGHSLLQLQRQYGNQFVARAIAQRDKRVDQKATSDGTVHRQAEKDEKKSAQMQPEDKEKTAQLQPEEEEKKVQMKSEDEELQRQTAEEDKKPESARG